MHEKESGVKTNCSEHKGKTTGMKLERFMTTRTAVTTTSNNHAAVSQKMNLRPIWSQNSHPKFSSIKKISTLFSPFETNRKESLGLAYKQNRINRRWKNVQEKRNENFGENLKVSSVKVY